MIKRWLQYLAVLAACLVFYFAYRQWMAWVILVGVGCLPLFSLIVSLPAMAMARLRLSLPPFVPVGASTQLDLQLDCPLPTPIWQVRVTARHSLENKLWLLQPGFDCPTEHCGALELKFTRCRVYDYMGLFFLPRRLPDTTLLIRPRPIRIPAHTQWEQRFAMLLRPKAGGGFSENHDLRLYRPGDSLRQIHWKASGKTGKLIYREPMVPGGDRLVLRLQLSGSPEELDRKLGRLLWLGLDLLAKGLPFALLAETARDPQRFPIDSEADLLAALDALLRCQVLAADSEAVAGNVWEYMIGGEPDETD